MTIFLFLGIVTVNNKEHLWNSWFVLATIVCCVVWRIMGVSF